MQNSRAKLLVGFIAVSVALLGALVARVAWTERSFVYWQDSVWVVGFAALFGLGMLWRALREPTASSIPSRGCFSRLVFLDGYLACYLE